MRLTDLDASFVAPTGRHGVAVQFRCPCGCSGTERAMRLVVPFTNPIDGGPSNRSTNANGITWQRYGDTLEELTLMPSVDVSHLGHWHGFVRDGETQ